MTLGQSIALGALQGITEFLPISSSGHLIFGEEILGLPLSILKSFDVMVHMGTLGAILIYFWKDIKSLFYALLATLRLTPKKAETAEYQKLIGAIIIGTIPAVFVGLYLEDIIDSIFRHSSIVALVMIALAVVYYLAENYPEEKKYNKVNGFKALMIGIAQAIAIIPGVSRSGSTIAAGLFLGVKRDKAARFSFLLGVPAILGAGILTGLKSNFGVVSFWHYLAGFIAALLFGLISIKFLMQFLKNHTLHGFAIYLIVIGMLFFILR